MHSQYKLLSRESGQKLRQFESNVKNHPKNHSLIRTAPEKHLLATTTCKKDYVLIVREIHIQKRSQDLILPKDSHTMLLFPEYH